MNRVATITTPNQTGTVQRLSRLRATDPGLLFDSDPATFTVTAVNDAPVVTDIPNQTIAEGGSFATINLDNYVSDVDNTDAEMTWTYSGNTQLTVVDSEPCCNDHDPCYRLERFRDNNVYGHRPWTCCIRQ